MIIPHDLQDNETPLHWAAEGGHMNVVKHLIECRAKLNIQSLVSNLKLAIPIDNLFS